jgi:hypothetical protein
VTGARLALARAAAVATVLLLALALGSADALASGNLNWGAGVEVALPANAAADPLVTLTDLACPSVGECTAVGSYTDGSGDEQGLLLSETSGVWRTAVEAALPVGAAANPKVSIDSVSCASPGNCAAVGYYADGSGIRRGLLLTETSGAWATGASAALPANAATHSEVKLSDVSCPSIGECTAIGAYTDSSGARQGLLLAESSGTWATGVEAVLPGNASASEPGVLLNGLACASAGNCVAVGQYDTSSTQAVILTETAGSWDAGVEVALPANAGRNAYLRSVSCPSIGECTAVGEYEDSFGRLQGLLLTETAGTWTTGAEATRPANALLESDVHIDDVSCPAAGYCTAFGNYWDSITDQQGLLLTDTSGRWATGVEAAHPADSKYDGNEEAPSLSCPAVGDCAIAAGYLNTSSFYSLLLTESAEAWGSSVEVSPPANAGYNPLRKVNSVACASPHTCTAIGEYGEFGGERQGMILEASPVSPNLSTSAASGGQQGSSISPSAALTAGAAPVGAIAFTVFGPQSSAPNSCTSGGTPAGTASVSGDGAYQPSTAFTPSAPGDYWWYASYGGDAGDNPAASTCGATMAETVVLPKAAPTLSVSGPTGGLAGNPITASSISATLSGGHAAAGTITFAVFGPQSAPPSVCASGATMVGTASVSGDGAYQPSAGFTPASAGDYWWYASYSGDASDNPAASTCGPPMAETVVAAAQTLGPAPGTSSGGPGLGPGPKAPAPALSGVKLEPKRTTGKKGVGLRFTLSQSATVRVLIAESLKAHRHAGVCKPAVKKGTSCTITLEKRILTFSGSAGSNVLKIKLTGLGVGFYTAAITAQNADGKSTPIKLTFTIARR